MHIVANAGPIRSRIIVSEYLQLRSFSQYGLESGWNQSRLSLMNLADFPAVVRACGIEIAERNRPHAICAVVGTERVLKEQLGGSIGIYWILQGLVGNWNRRRTAVGGAC